MLNKSKGILLRLVLGILVASLFLPVFIAIKPHTATADGCDLEIGLTTLTDSPGIVSSNIVFEKSTVAIDEKFKVYFEVILTPEMTTECQSAGKSYFFGISNTRIRFLTNGKDLLDIPATLYPSGNKYAAVTTTSLKELGMSGTQISPTCPSCAPTPVAGYSLYGFFLTQATTRGNPLGPKTSYTPYLKVDSKGGAPHPSDGQIPADVKETQNLDLGTEGVPYDELKFRVGIDATTPGLDADKYRHFYRISLKDDLVATSSGSTPATTTTTPPASSPATSPDTSTTTSSKYNTTLTKLSSLVIPIWMTSEAKVGLSWGITKTAISYSSLGAKLGSWGGTHKINDLSVIAVEDKKSADPKVCGPLTFNNKQLACLKKEVATLPESPDNKLLSTEHQQFPFKVSIPDLKQLGVQDSTSSTATLFKVFLAPTLRLDAPGFKEFLVAPTPIFLADTFNAIYGFSYTADAQKIYFEVYPDKASLEAHKNDPPPAGVEPYSETVTSSTTKSSDTAADLFNFLRKVISYLVLLCTSVIYWIFATILVPILNSLLSIRPYQDQFVNFIYPGWVIMRNLANIMFILALLWMGLRTLFQVDDSSKTRGLILWLILMALLVNFSLVIAQGVVGVADTVQSQFLPKESKVIEALGQKLMVDPIKFFRGQNEDAKITDNSNFTVSSSAADITKPIVLLILALAAFFSFVALVGFILMRLVALWLLYMISPIAYAARILPETKQYFDKWWDQFIRNAFTVPILALFLNIAALMATTFAKRSGDSVIAGRDPNYILGSASGGVAEFAITVMSHFIVLFFIYAGMYYANQSGALGAKQIVKFAKSGFDFVVKSIPQKAWQGVKSATSSAASGAASLAGGLKDRAGEGIANSKFLEGKEKSQMAVRSIFRPKEAFKAAKKGYWDEPNALLNKGFADSFDKMSKKIQPWGEDKLLPLKMAYWKLDGQKAGSFRNAGENKSMQAEIMNNDERNKIANDRGGNQQKLNNVNRKLAGITTASDKLKLLDKDVIQANADYAADKSVANRDKLRTAVSARKAQKGEVDRLIAADGSEIDLRNMKSALQMSIDKATKEIENDQSLRKKTGFGDGEMNDTKRKELLKDASDLIAKAESREKPFSKTLEREDASEVLKASKDIKDLDLDYEQMESGFEEALKKNNSVQARAYLKQITESGMIDKLLKNKNKDYNAGGLADLVKESFKSSSRNQTTIIREISNAAAKSGNLPLAYAVKSLQNGAGVLKSAEKQMKDVADKIQKTPLKDLKSGDVKFYNSVTNKTEITPGLVDSIKAHNGEEKSKIVARDMSKKVATDILSQLSSSQKLEIGENIHSALKSAAGR